MSQKTTQTKIPQKNKQTMLRKTKPTDEKISVSPCIRPGDYTVLYQNLFNMFQPCIHFC